MIARPTAGQSKYRSQSADKPSSVDTARLLHRGGVVTIIPLGPGLLAGSSDLPGDNGRAVRSARQLASPDCCRPIWSCSVRGFACHPCCHGRGALLPHLFTLTLHSPSRARSGRYFFCATVPSDCSARALPGALPSGVRTFLPPPPFRLRRGRPEGPLAVTWVRKPAIVWPTTTSSIIARAPLCSSLDSQK